MTEALALQLKEEIERLEIGARPYIWRMYVPEGKHPDYVLPAALSVNLPLHRVFQILGSLGELRHFDHDIVNRSYCTVFAFL